MPQNVYFAIDNASAQVGLAPLKHSDPGPIKGDATTLAQTQTTKANLATDAVNTAGNNVVNGAGKTKDDGNGTILSDNSASRPIGYQGFLALCSVVLVIWSF